MLELASIPRYVNYLLRQQQGFKVGWIGQVMAVNESSRLQQSLQKEGVPVKRLIINQILPPSSSDCKFCAIKRKVCTADG
jgi:anion-transporting  ArsA/GET3 family ATPase